MKISTEDRFWRHVEKMNPNGCWAWQGAKNNSGYGVFLPMSRQTGGVPVLAHRFSLALEGRFVPSGLAVDHLCRNRSCVNPSHLEIVTMRVNVLRGEGRAAREAKQILCLRGHPLFGPNLSLDKKRDGSLHRRCLACRRLRGD